MSAIRRFVNLTTQKPKICGAMVPPLNISDSALQAVSLYASHFRSVSLRFDAFSVASPSRFKADWYVSFNLESTVLCRRLSSSTSFHRLGRLPIVRRGLQCRSAHSAMSSRSCAYHFTARMRKHLEPAKGFGSITTRLRSPSFH